MDDHARRASKLGIDDHQSWCSYASIFEIHFWQEVLRSRFGDQGLRDFQTRVDTTLNGIIGLDEERIRTLRKRHNALLAGRRSSLRGSR